VDASGRIVLAGTAGIGGMYGVALVRVLPDGRLDPTFGEQGLALANLSQYTIETGLVLQPDGKPVIAATLDRTTATASIGLARFTSAGRLDPTFGVGGKTVVSGGYLHASGLTATPGGDWIVGGFSDTTSGPIALRFLGPGSTAPSSSEDTCRKEASLQPEAAVDFGSRAVGTVSPPRSFTFTSTGSGPIRVEAVGLANNNAGQFRVVSDECSGRTVPAKASCTVSVSLTPTRVDGMGSRLIVWHDGRAGSNGTYLMGRGSSTVSPPTTVPPTTTTSAVPPPTARTAAGIDPITAATGVAVDRNVVVTFSEAVERSSAQAAFSLRRAGTTVNLGGAFTWDAASTVMTFNPFANLLATLPTPWPSPRRPGTPPAPRWPPPSNRASPATPRHPP